MNSLGKSFWTTLLVTIAAFISVAYTACKKTESTPAPNKCANVSCKNGGSCFDGRCSCQGGFEGDRCEIKAMDRVTGSWEATENVTGSSLAANLATNKKYDLAIEPLNNVEFVLNNFMGEADYDNVKGRIGMNAKNENARYTEFGIVLNQTITGTPVYIKSGGGSVNEFGNTISGSYIRSYATTGGIVTDTVSIVAFRK